MEYPVKFVLQTSHLNLIKKKEFYTYRAAQQCVITVLNHSVRVDEPLLGVSTGGRGFYKYEGEAWKWINVNHSEELCLVNLDEKRQGQERRDDKCPF